MKICSLLSIKLALSRIVYLADMFCVVNWAEVCYTDKAEPSLGVV